MKIALMTISRVKNFGAEMQCYATVKALRQLGHDVKVIDFRLSENKVKSAKSAVVSAIVRLSPDNRTFSRFWHKNIPYTHYYSSKEDLIKNPPVADLYISGSDQIWNPDITAEKWDTYMLNFGQDTVRRCAYASSLGEDLWKWPDIKSEAYRLLGRFESIAVREQSGKELLKNEFNINSQVVLDPTLLHTGYEEIVNVGKTKKTLVYYPLIDNEDLKKFSKDLASDMNLEWINTNNKKRFLGKVVWQRTSIYDWIKNIGEASLVVTPSFHGVAFSLIYGRQFIVIQNQKGNNRSSRITGLLEKLGLSDRYFTSIEDAKASEIWNKPIDYIEVNRKLELLRIQSWQYLKEITSRI